MEIKRPKNKLEETEEICWKHLVSWIPYKGFLSGSVVHKKNLIKRWYFQCITLQIRCPAKLKNYATTPSDLFFNFSKTVKFSFDEYILQMNFISKSFLVRVDKTQTAGSCCLRTNSENWHPLQSGQREDQTQSYTAQSLQDHQYSIFSVGLYFTNIISNIDQFYSSIEKLASYSHNHHPP